MDVRKVKKLIELLEESGLTEIEIREGEESIRLSRAASGSPPVTYVPAPTVVSADTQGVSVPVEDAPQEPDGHAIHSPMVGTYYGSASPETRPFVEAGSLVEAGDTLCIIEAMKIFNQIEADRAGTVRTIMKESGDPVEYGELLFVLE